MQQQEPVDDNCEDIESSFRRASMTSSPPTQLGEEATPVRTKRTFSIKRSPAPEEDEQVLETYSPKPKVASHASEPVCVVAAYEAAEAEAARSEADFPLDDEGRASETLPDDLFDFFDDYCTSGEIHTSQEDIDELPPVPNFVDSTKESNQVEPSSTNGKKDIIENEAKGRDKRDPIPENVKLSTTKDGLTQLRISES